MPTRPTRYLTERDLRALSTADLLDLIQTDIRELDRARRARPRSPTESPPAAPPPPADKLRRQRRPPQRATEELVPEIPALYAVECCNCRIGEFVHHARVRCPFCGTWHRAGQ